jgi:hypothetical protein
VLVEIILILLLHVPEWSSTQHKALEIKPFHENTRSAVDSAQDVLLRNKHVLEDKLARVGASHAEFVELARHREAGGCRVDDERRNALGCQLGLGLGVDDDIMGIRSLGGLVELGENS